MSTHPDPDQISNLAAEYALGLLDGAELRRAQDLARTDSMFRREVERWSGRLAPMFDEVDEVRPPANMWTRIDAALGAVRADSNILVMRRKLNAWRGVAAAMTALAACLALVLLIRLPPVAPTPQLAPAAPMVAMLGDQRKQMQVVASWDPRARQLILAVAGDMPADPRHSHELWVIPQGGKPRSLGTMGTGKQMHMRLADALAELLQQGATIAISVEPPGGSPTGAPTGPVVASGSLEQA
jgi:anti-sigma-K factor RskA